MSMVVVGVVFTSCYQDDLAAGKSRLEGLGEGGSAGQKLNFNDLTHNRKTRHHPDRTLTCLSSARNFPAQSVCQMSAAIGNFQLRKRKIRVANG